MSKYCTFQVVSNTNKPLLQTFHTNRAIMQYNYSRREGMSEVLNHRSDLYIWRATKVCAAVRQVLGVINTL